MQRFAQFGFTTSCLAGQILFEKRKESLFNIPGGANITEPVFQEGITRNHKPNQGRFFNQEPSASLVIRRDIHTMYAKEEAHTQVHLQRT